MLSAISARWGQRPAYGFAAVIVDEPASMVSTAEGAHEIVIRTDGLAIHVPPQASTEHVARVLAAVRQAG